MKIEKNVSKETYELVKGVCGFLHTIVNEYKDGLDVGDIPDILTSALTDLIPAFEGFSKVDDEMITDPQGFSGAAGELVSEILLIMLELRNGRSTSS